MLNIQTTLAINFNVNFRFGSESSNKIENFSFLVIF